MSSFRVGTFLCLLFASAEASSSDPRRQIELFIPEDPTAQRSSSPLQLSRFRRRDESIENGSAVERMDEPDLATEISPIPDIPSWASSFDKDTVSRHTRQSASEGRGAVSVDLQAFAPTRNRKGESPLSISVNPEAGIRLAQVLTLFSGSFGAAFFGTLRLLAPLIAARRVLYYFLNVAQDWYTGRYLRKTYNSLEWKYWRKYQVPAVLRSIGRLTAHLIVLTLLGRFMEWMVNLEQSPCSISSVGGCHWSCGILWILAVTGTGHAGAAAIAIWGGPLRIRVEYGKNRPSARRIFTRPWSLLQWMRDPDSWLREIASDRKDPTHALKPFHPDPRMFPATWGPLRILQMIAVAKEMTGGSMRSLMRQILIQQAFGDEWYRALMVEKRVALAIGMIVGYFLSTATLLWTAIRKPVPSISSLSTLLMLPSVAAVLISAWMNILVYFERRDAKKTEQTSGLPLSQ